MIQFAINKAYFLQALHTTRRAISSKNAIPILSTIKIEVTKDGIYLTGSNGQISIENSISVSEENAGLLITQPGSILWKQTFSLMLSQACLMLPLLLKKSNNTKFY